MELNPWIAAGLALFLWWFLTGAILMIVKRRKTAAQPGVTTLALLPIALGSGLVLWLNPSAPGALAPILSFLAALGLWGWIELAFLTGVITGPNRNALPPGVPEWERFIRAWGTIAYHELLLVSVLLALMWIAVGPGLDVGFWTFAVLFFARVSAKLNLFLGVPKINVEFLPEALSHLPSHFRTARVNWLFPVSITALSFAVACWLERIYTAQSHADVIGFTLLAALTALALLEHWLMVLPLPDAKLWRWMLPASETSLINEKHKTDRPSEEAHGL